MTTFPGSGPGAARPERGWVVVLSVARLRDGEVLVLVVVVGPAVAVAVGIHPDPDVEVKIF